MQETRSSPSEANDRGGKRCNGTNGVGDREAGTDTVPAGNGTSLRNTTGGVTPVVSTVSLSGSTAMRNFLISPGMTLLNTTPGSSITLGPIGNEITYTLGGSASLQLRRKTSIPTM